MRRHNFAAFCGTTLALTMGITHAIEDSSHTMDPGTIEAAANVMLDPQGCSIAATSAQWPDNEPDGMTPVFFSDGSNLDWGSGWNPSEGWENNRARIDVVEDPTSKYGQAIEKRGFVGDRSGWLGATNVGRDANRREVYVRFVWRLSDNWDFHASGVDKLFYWGRAWDARSGTQFFVGQRRDVGLWFVNQGAPEWGEADAQGAFAATNLPGVSRGAYHTVEVHQVLNTPGRSDGSIRVWLDGIEVESWNHLGRPDRGAVQLRGLRWVDWQDDVGEPHRFNSGQWFLFWGGQGDTKQVDDWIRLSELYISVR